MCQPWPLSKERREELVPEESLVREFIRLDGREVVRKLLHADAQFPYASIQKRPSARFPLRG
jgi:hypothetical protein